MRQRPSTPGEQAVDAVFAEILRVGENASEIRGILERRDPDDAVLVAVLRRAVPVRFLECVANTTPWSERRLVLGGVVRNPRVPRVLGLKLLPSLFWRDLAETAASPWVQGALRVRAEALLKEMIPDLRLGEKITLGRLATAPVLPGLLSETDPKVLDAVFVNPRLRAEDLLVQMRSETVSVALLEAVARSDRWREHYAVRVGLVLQPRTPLALALGQITALVPRDLRRVAETPGLRPVLQIAALRVAEGR